MTRQRLITDDQIKLILLAPVGEPQTEIAARIGVPVHAVYNYRSGHTKQALIIADQLGLERPFERYTQHRPAAGTAHHSLRERDLIAAVQAGDA